MTTANQASLRVLQGMLAECERQLKEAAPEAFAEAQLLRQIISSRQQGEKPYAASPHTPPLLAVKLCLAEFGTWVTRGQVLDALETSGYIQSKARRGVISSAINHHLEVGNLKRANDEEGVNTVIGLPHWKEGNKKIA